MINTDVATQILLLSDCLKDLRSTILVARVFLDAFQQRKQLITGSVLCREIRSAGYLSKQCALIQTDNKVKRLSRSVTNNAILLYEGLRPLMLSVCTRQGKRTVTPHCPWTLKLARLYADTGATASNRRLILLKEAYAGILSIEPNFDPLATVLSTASQPRSCARLSKAQLDVCRELVKEYTLKSRLHDTLQVQKNVLQRLALRDLESSEWSNAIMKTFRALHDSAGAISYAMSLYHIARADKCLDSSLSWGRHLVAEYSSVGNWTEASRQQEQILSHLQPGTREHIAWARRLIALQKRAGCIDDALSTRAAIWQQMDGSNVCFFGWARQLAGEYRRVYKNSEALAVMERMYQEAMRQSTRLPKDEARRFHVIHSARTLAAEYEYCKRFEDAQFLLQQVGA